jgi:hypothetical protein
MKRVTDEQIKALEAKLDAVGGERPYVTIYDGDHVYVVSKKLVRDNPDWKPDITPC